MKAYTQSAMNLVSNPTLLVTTCIGGSFLTAQLQELPALLKKDKLTTQRPMGTSVEGTKNGIFPVLTPKTLAAKLALTLKGYPCEINDGWSFVTQAAASDVTRELLKLGVTLDELAFEWMVGQPQGATPAQAAAATEPKPQTKGESTEANSAAIFG